MGCRRAVSGRGSTGPGAIAALLGVVLTACGSPGAREEGPPTVLQKEDRPTASPRNSVSSATASEMDQFKANDEYGIWAFFPRGAVVCEARSWEHPIGFYTFLGEPRECGYPYDPPVARFVQVFAGYNTFFAPTPEGHLPCPDGPLPADVNVELRGLVLQSMDSFTCASAEENGRIVVGVSGMGGGPNIQGPGEPQTESVLYSALLSTRAEHLDEDLDLFRDFVRRLRFFPAE
jgi:hypothetical protein